MTVLPSRSNTVIGFNSIVMPGVTIGDRVIVASNSVVTKDIPDRWVVGGLPTQKIKELAAAMGGSNFVMGGWTEVVPSDAAFLAILAFYEELSKGLNTTEAFDKVLKLNVTTVFAMTRDFTPLLEKAASRTDPARVINIGSIDGLHVPRVHGIGTYAYTASKAAVHHLTRHLAVELGSRHITVNAIAPGFFYSKMTAGIFEKFGDKLAGNSLLGRVGEPADIAGLAIYLSSRAGGYVNATVIAVDGGTITNHLH